MEFPDIPGYKVERLIATGGMASVFLAEQISMSRQVALKVMSPHLLNDASFGERFLREARIVAQLNHPNFVSVYDVGRHGDHHYLSMEYIPGGDLKRQLAKGISLADGISIVKDIASALHHASERHFIHRDIKPENLLMREDFSAVICDFGIAKRTDTSTQMTIVGTVVGTPNYMSPEQAQAGNLDGRADLYSLGIILYEILCGDVPFKGDSAVATGIMHITEPIPELREEIAVFQPIIEQALAKRPEDRFQDGMEFLYALEELEESEYDLIHSVSDTMVLSSEEIKSGLRKKGSTGSSSRSAMRRSSGQRSTGERSAAHRRTAGQRSLVRRGGGRTSLRHRAPGNSVSGRSTPPPRSATKSRVMALSVAASLGVGATGWWIYETTTTPAPKPRDSFSSMSGISNNLENKGRELRKKALEAFDAGRLYGPGNDNAQYYLTSLLVIYPQDDIGSAKIKALFETYLNQAEQAMSNGDFRAANEVLNQASQISFYVEDASLAERQRNLRQDFIAAQQKAFMSAERVGQIEQLESDAAEFLDQDKLTSPPGDNAYERYQQLLSLDPANSVALAGMQQIAGRFLDKATQQTEQGELGRARAFLNAAVQIFPRHPDLPRVRETLQSEESSMQDSLLQKSKDSSASADDRKLVEQTRVEKASQIKTLLATAATQLKSDRLGRPQGNNAIETYQQILELDPANVDALNGLEDVAVRYIELADTEIKSSNLERAARYLEQARNLSPSSSRYAMAQGRLIAARDASSQKAVVNAGPDKNVSSVTSLRASATQLQTQSGGITTTNFRQLADINLDILRQVPGDQQAERALDKIASFSAEDIRSATKGRNFPEAEASLAYLQQLRPDYPELEQLRADLDKAREQRSSAMELLREAQTMIDQPYTKPGVFGNNRTARRNLRQAAGSIRSAVAMDGETASSIAAEGKLVNKYLDIIEIHLEDGDNDEAREFAEDLDNLQLSEQQLAVVDRELGELQRRMDKVGRVNINAF